MAPTAASSNFWVVGGGAGNSGKNDKIYQSFRKGAGQMKFPKGHIKCVWNYILQHDGETLLRKNISRDTGVSVTTVTRDIQWLERRQFIRREGKNFSVLM